MFDIYGYEKHFGFEMDILLNILGISLYQPSKHCTFNEWWFNFEPTSENIKPQFVKCLVFAGSTVYSSPMIMSSTSIKQLDLFVV